MNPAAKPQHGVGILAVDTNAEVHTPERTVAVENVTKLVAAFHCGPSDEGAVDRLIA